MSIILHKLLISKNNKKKIIERKKYKIEYITNEI